MIRNRERKRKPLMCASAYNSEFALENNYISGSKTTALRKMGPMTQTIISLASAIPRPEDMINFWLKAFFTTGFISILEITLSLGGSLLSTRLFTRLELR